MMDYVFHPEAEADYENAVSYYRQEARPGTSSKFVQRVREAIETILGDPEACPAVAKAIRRQRVWGFPYDLLFGVHKQIVTIVAVASHSRDDKFWQERV